jgi:DNA-binding transcriptional ArsR family regulator
MVLAEGPLLLGQVAEAAGLTKSHVSYWLPRMVDRGLLLRLKEGEQTYYLPQPVFLDPAVKEALYAAFYPVAKNHKKYFVFDQATATQGDVLKVCIAKTLKLFCLDVRDLE